MLRVAVSVSVTAVRCPAVSRETGANRRWVDETANQETCPALLGTRLPPGRIRYRAALAGDPGWPDPCTVGHSAHKWARDADGARRRAVHGNPCAGSGAARRRFVRRGSGVHKVYLAGSVAIDEAMTNVRGMTAHLVRRRCLGMRVHANSR